MLAYQHAYHAGNIADVHKHLTLHALLARLQTKSSAMTCIDTHAGRGLYPLTVPETQRGGEYQTGILPLWEKRATLAAQNGLLKEWLTALATLNPDGILKQYPGSPWWFGHQLRDQDRLTLYELHPGEAGHLKEARAALPPNIKMIHGDGPERLLAQLPVATPRLCVLIDPSYEIKQDYAQMATVLASLAAKVRHAVVVVWYPLLPEARHHALLDTIVASGLRKIWQSELIYRTAETRGMYGSGLLVFNPPWQLDSALNSALSVIAAGYGDGVHHHGRWLVSE